MKTLACVDELGTSHDALHLVGKLRFRDPDVTLLHVIERLSLAVPDPTGTMPPTVIAKIIGEQDRVAREALSEAETILKGYGIRARTEIKEGFADSQIFKEADALNVDLIAVGSAQKGRLESLLAGSISRKVVGNAKQSVLVGRPVRDTSREGVRAVFATDHSEYSHKAVRKLLELAPQGIEKLTVMSAFYYDAGDIIAGVVPGLDDDVKKWSMIQLTEQNHTVAKQLRPIARDVDDRVIDAKPEIAIPMAMDEAKADLLIVAAHGRGWLFRVMIGGVAYEQAVRSPYSTLVLRIS